MSYALIFWTKSRTRSVVAKAAIPTCGKVVLSVGDTVTVPFGKKSYEGKIMQFSGKRQAFFQLSMLLLFNIFIYKGFEKKI